MVSKKLRDFKYLKSIFVHLSFSIGYLWEFIYLLPQRRYPTFVHDGSHHNSLQILLWDSCSVFNSKPIGNSRSCRKNPSDGPPWKRHCVAMVRIGHPRQKQNSKHLNVPVNNLAFAAKFPPSIINSAIINFHGGKCFVFYSNYHVPSMFYSGVLKAN